MKSRVSSKGQVTVPVEVREALGLYAGTPVVFEVRDGGAWMHKGGAAEHPLDRAYGLLKNSAHTFPTTRLSTKPCGSSG